MLSFVNKRVGKILHVGVSHCAILEDLYSARFSSTWFLQCWQFLQHLILTVQAASQVPTFRSGGCVLTMPFIFYTDALTQWGIADTGKIAPPGLANFYGKQTISLQELLSYA